MAQLKVPEAPREYTTHYRNLLGVDYQNDQTEVSPRRSPEMINMISDLGGNPVKRSGFRRIGNAYAGFAAVNGDPWAVKKYSVGLRALQLTIDSYGNLIEPTDDSDIIRLDDSANCGDIKAVFGASGILYILCTKGWYSYDTINKKQLNVGIAEDMLYTMSGSDMTLEMPDPKLIPVVMTMYQPNGRGMVVLPDGTDITGATKGVNILTPYRTIEYCVTTDTAAKKIFVIPDTKKMSNVIKVEVLDSDTFDWKTITTGFVLPTASSKSTVKPDNPTAVVSTSVVNAKITFDTSPYTTDTEDGVTYLVFRDDTSVRVPAGVPNVRITYAPWSTEKITVEDTEYSKGFYREDRCGLYNVNASEWYDARLFVAYRSRAYYSRASSPFVIDDDFYFTVDDDIVRFAKTSSSLAVIGEDNGNNTIYLAKGEYESSLAMPVYVLKSSSASVGSIAPKVVGVMNDEPMILAKTGLYGLSTNYLSENYAVSRSGKINRKLCKEANLNTAVGIEFNHYFYIAVNGHMYVLDGRHRDTSKHGDSSYECYFFNNMPDIKAMYVISNRMYFVDENYTYTWNDDMPEYCRYYDYLAGDLDDDFTGQPVKARWCTLFDDDGAPQRMKTLMKKGTMALLLPYYNTGCEIYLVKDGDIWQYLGRFDSTMTTFDYWDFIEVDFSSNVVSADVFTKKKMKKYKRLQFVLENNKPEPFGIVGLTKTYIFGNYAKR